jgi:hypothetical protein
MEKHYNFFIFREVSLTIRQGLMNLCGNRYFSLISVENFEQNLTQFRKVIPRSPSCVCLEKFLVIRQNIFKILSKINGVIKKYVVFRFSDDFKLNSI